MTVEQQQAAQCEAFRRLRALDMNQKERILYLVRHNTLKGLRRLQDIINSKLDITKSEIYRCMYIIAFEETSCAVSIKAFGEPQFMTDYMDPDESQHRGVIMGSPRTIYKTLRREVLDECKQLDRNRIGLDPKRWTFYEARKLAQRNLLDLRRRFYPTS